MVKVVGVRFKRAGKVYYFDPGEFELAKGAQVIVETARGIEFGETVGPAKEVTEEELTTPLKKVIRVATDADAAQLKENQTREKEALAVAARKISEHNPEMDLVDVEYTFDGNKIIFYFTAEGRVDFRDLVRDLAAVFRTRIELRQIGVRDEAKMLGGIGPCGRALCCATFLGDFAPVSIKMAKEQNLSLNPTKISGLCGRLLCCLRYESDHYERAKAAFPAVGTPVSTKDGDGRVASINIIKSVISVEFPTGVTHDYPVDSVRPRGASSAPQRAEVVPNAVLETTPDVAQPVAVSEGSEAPCTGCAGSGSCPRVEGQEEALKEDAVLVAEAVAVEGEPPVVTVYAPPQSDTPRHDGPRQRPDNARHHNRPNGGNHGERHQSGSGDRAQQPGNGDQKQQPGGQRSGGNQRRGSQRHHNGGDRPRNDSRPQQPADRPSPKPRNEERDNHPSDDGRHRSE